MRRSAKLAAIASLAALPLTGAMVAPANAQYGAPPVPQVEAVPPPPVAVPNAYPGAYWVWQPGYWRWNGRRYIWFPGRYVASPYARAVWEPGNWVLVRGRWVWREGHWRR